jgi:hypothetical protein
MNERYKNNPSTNPDIDSNLWSEVRSSGGPDRNRMYGLLNNTIGNLRTTHSALIVGCLQSIPNTQTSEFVAMLDQRVQDWTTHLNDKYERLIANYKEIC